MQITALMGLILGFAGIMAGNILEGGNPASLVNLPAFLIIIGGTMGATMLSYPASGLAGLPKAFGKVFSKVALNPEEFIKTLTMLAEKARREGLLSLESEAQNVTDSFLKKGLELIVDGTDPEIVEETLRNELYVLEKRHEGVYAVLEGMGGYAPTMGVLGTVMGLIHVLAGLGEGDMEKLGHAIAGAFIATLYGVGFANLIFLPLGARLKRLSQTEVVTREMMIEGVLAIQAGENPRVIQQKLLGYLAPKARDRAVNEPRREGAAVD